MKRFVSVRWTHWPGENIARYTNAADHAALNENAAHVAATASLITASGSAIASVTHAHPTKVAVGTRFERTASARSAPAIRPSIRQNTLLYRLMPCADKYRRTMGDAAITTIASRTSCVTEQY